jgi:hypothetical protein
MFGLVNSLMDLFASNHVGTKICERQKTATNCQNKTL